MPLYIYKYIRIYSLVQHHISYVYTIDLCIHDSLLFVARHLPLLFGCYHEFTVLVGQATRRKRKFIEFLNFICEMTDLFSAMLDKGHLSIYIQYTDRHIYYSAPHVRRAEASVVLYIDNMLYAIQGESMTDSQALQAYFVTQFKKTYAYF